MPEKMFVFEGYVPDTSMISVETVNDVFPNLYEALSPAQNKLLKYIFEKTNNGTKEENNDYAFLFADAAQAVYGIPTQQNLKYLTNDILKLSTIYIQIKKNRWFSNLLSFIMTDKFFYIHSYSQLFVFKRAIEEQEVKKVFDNLQ